MPISKSNPEIVHAPAGNYSHLAVVPAGYGLLVYWPVSWN